MFIIFSCQTSILKLVKIMHIENYHSRRCIGNKRTVDIKKKIRMIAHETAHLTMVRYRARYCRTRVSDNVEQSKKNRIQIKPEVAPENFAFLFITITCNCSFASSSNPSVENISEELKFAMTIVPEYKLEIGFARTPPTSCSW